MIIFKSNITSTIIAKSKWGAININLNKDQKYFSTTNFYAQLVYALDVNKIKHGINQIDDKINNEEYKFIDITQRVTKVNKTHLDNLIDKNKEVKILIINGFVSGIGDNIVGLTALRIFLNHYKNEFKKITVDCYNENILRIYSTLSRYNLINKYLSFPQNMETLKEYDYIIDLDNIHEWIEFNQMPMVDCFLSVMGIDYNKVEDNKKRNEMTIDTNSYNEIKSLFKGIKYNDDRKLLLLQYDSSAKIRAISNMEILKRIIDKIINKSDYRIVLLGDLDIEHERILKLKKFSSTLDHYISIVSQIDLAITTDTSAYHITDPLNKPTVSLFTSIKPELRVKYYPYVKGILLSDPSNRIMGKFDSMNPTDLEYVDNIWNNLDIDMVFSELNKIEPKKDK